MNFRPLHDRILVRRVQADQKSAGGLIIPDTAKEKPMEGEVIAVGNGQRLGDGTTREITVAVGQRILFGKYAGDEVKFEGEEHVIIREEEILAIIER